MLLAQAVFCIWALETSIICPLVTLLVTKCDGITSQICYFECANNNKYNLISLFFNNLVINYENLARHLQCINQIVYNNYIINLIIREI